MGKFNGLKLWLCDALDVIFPRLCEVCGRTLMRGEKVICLECDYAMPRCRCHSQPFSHIHQKLAGRIPVGKAAAMFYYQAGSPYVKLIHAAKYSGRPDVARHLAGKFAREIACDGFFDGIDLIIPVPLHRRKQLSRGYNQSFYIAQGLSDATGLPVGGSLKAVRHHPTQTQRGIYERWLNSQNVYVVDDASGLTGRHILLVDDVITTGATLLACCEAIHKASPTSEISVLGLSSTALF
ncbi:MAG: ComF family protein [Paramuribaculum sp.]|nr:ComF family protein [Paramuribaculum sp.]MDE6323259.1 ComF family protein [Paramuribaculum sp.]